MQRSAPRRAYFEFEDHPAAKIVYTFNLDKHRKYRTPKVKKVEV